MTWPKSVLLKGAPPLAKKSEVERPRLALHHFSNVGAHLIEVSAPQGYGKTTLLGQWYAQSQNAIWLSLDEHSDSDSLVQGLAYASSRKRGGLLEEPFVDWMRATSDPYEALTGWIVELGQSGVDVLLLLDDADYLPLALQEQELAFILANAPSNLQIAISTRPGNGILRQSAFLGSPMVRISALELSFTEEETIKAATLALHEEVAGETGTRLFALSDGWPLGVQMALASLLGTGQVVAPKKALSLSLEQYFNDGIIERQSPPVKDLLAGLAYLDPVHPDLCRAIAGPDAPVAEVVQLADATPLLVRSASPIWLRVHPAARPLLSALQNRWPEAHRKEIAHAAAVWYSEKGLFHEAANQARLADDAKMTLDMAVKAIREMTVHGRTAEVIKWIENMSPEDIECRPDIWLPAAWAEANSNRPDRVVPLLNRVLAKPDLTKLERFEALLIDAAMAGFRDDLPKLQQFSDDWPEPEEGAAENERLLHSIYIATGHHLAGRPTEIRKTIQKAIENIGGTGNSAIIHAYLDFYHGLSFLWEGKPELAYEYLKPALRRVEAEFDRRSRVAAILAVTYAEACIEINLFQEARRAIASRMPLIEKLRPPDALISGFTVAARMAENDGRTDLAEVQFSALIAAGKARSLPRLQAVGLSLLARLHVRHGQMGNARACSEQLEDLVNKFGPQLPDPMRHFLELQAALAKAASLDLNTKFEPRAKPIQVAQNAFNLAKQLHRGRDQLLAQALHGRAMMQQDAAQGLKELKEASATAKAWGLKRLHQDLEGIDAPVRYPHEFAQAPHAPRSPGATLQPDILTPREYDILYGLAAHLGNKEIALSLGLSHETVKWHLKNLFQKLDASDRKVAVVRARIIGLL